MAPGFFLTQIVHSSDTSWESYKWELLLDRIHYIIASLYYYVLRHYIIARPPPHRYPTCISYFIYYTNKVDFVDFVDKVFFIRLRESLFIALSFPQRIPLSMHYLLN